MCYPQAVSTDIKDFVPNAYQLIEIRDAWMSIPVQAEIGDKIKLILKDGVKIAHVIASTPERIKVDVDHKGEVFVFGFEVDDFHTVNYEALSMLNISATQELIKQIEMLKEDRHILKAIMVAQGKKIDALMEHLGLSEKAVSTADK